MTFLVGVKMSFSHEELEEFKAEAFDLLDTAEKSLLSLDQGAEFRPMFDSIFRCFHNLKGSAGMMELNELQSHTHELENILMQFKGADSLPKEYIGLFLRGVDATRSILNGETVNFNFDVNANVEKTEELKSESQNKIEAVPATQENKNSTKETSIEESKEAEPQVPASALGEFLAECDETIERVSKYLQKIENNTYTKETIDSLYRDVHSMKGSAYLFSFNVLGDLTHAMESSLEKIREGTHLPSCDLLNVLFKSVTVVEKILSDIKTKSTDQGSAKLVAKAVEALNHVASRLEEASPEKKQEKAKELVVTPNQQTKSAKSESPKDNEALSSIRVGVSLLDNLMTLMGELVLARNQVLQYANKMEDLEFQNMSKRLNVITSEIQGEMMKTRLQPIGNILSKFNRVVRDLSHDLGKNIQLQISGSETELDKSLLESIKDPLTHIVRNSCDHGIEMPEVREQSGKPRAGTIQIKSYHEGGQVVVEVIDDGKGLNRTALINKAIEKGIITASQGASLSEKEAFNLIFQPGFSTAAQVTSVSGRGVGMDVVRTNIEKIGGTVDLHSVEGQGTTIKIKVPLTLAIIPALLVKSHNKVFAIPQVKLEELIRVDASSADQKVEILQGVPVYRLRGDILPLVDLNKILGMQKAPRNYNDGVTNIAVLNADHCTFGLIIDEVMDTADIVVKPLNRLLKSLQVYAGATVLGDGTVALILDVLGISKLANIESENEAGGKLKDKSEQQVHLETQEFLVVQVGSPTKHALPLGYVHRLEEFKKKDIEYYGHQRIIRYRGEMLPLIIADEVFGYNHSENEEEVISVIVIQKADLLYGIQVSKILDILSTQERVNPDSSEVPGIFGSLITKDELIVVVDPYVLIDTQFPDVERHTWSSKDSDVSSQIGSKYILLAEDTLFFRRAIISALEKGGHRVHAVNDGKEALEALSHSLERFDLIVSDIEMPNMNGFELAKAVRNHPSYSSIPLLAVSSRADKSYIEKGKEAGFDVYLEKLKTDTLLEAVAYLTHGKEGAA